MQGVSVFVLGAGDPGQRVRGGGLQAGGQEQGVRVCVLGSGDQGQGTETGVYRQGGKLTQKKFCRSTEICGHKLSVKVHK